ncbi:mCG1030191 [Mus musculus]|nr:mCG1030191 [Mus musculus]
MRHKAGFLKTNIMRVFHPKRRIKPGVVGARL